MRHVGHDSFIWKGETPAPTFKWGGDVEARLGERTGSRRGFRGARSHDHGVGRGRLICRLGPARPPRVLHALGVAVVEAGNRADAGRSRGSAPSPALPLL